MPRLILTSIVIALTACGSSGSGVPMSKKLTELDANEREKLCNYVVDAEGGVRTKLCGDGVEVTTQTAADCITGLTVGLAGNCAATVDTAEACAEASGDDVCNLLSSPACLSLFMCVRG